MIVNNLAWNSTFKKLRYWHLVPSFMANRYGKSRNRFFSLTPKRSLLLERKGRANLDNVLKSRDISLLTKVHRVNAMVFCSSYVQMWELDHNEDWALKNWCFQIVMLEKTLESPWDCKEIKSVYPKGNQSWIFIARNDDEAEAPILWPPDVKRQLIGKDL